MKAARKNMVDCQIHPNGVIHPAILKAFETVPRELFAPEMVKSVAYGDEDLPLGNGRFLLAPTVHAKMIQAAEPKADEKVLDVGGGTGYSAAILSSMVGKVIALEQCADCLEKAGGYWRKLGLHNIESLKGDMTKGEASRAPFDLILVNGAVAEIPAILADQLTPEGRMILILRNQSETTGKALLVKKTPEGFSSRPLFDAAASWLPGFEPKPSFKF